MTREAKKAQAQQEEEAARLRKALDAVLADLRTEHEAITHLRFRLQDLQDLHGVLDDARRSYDQTVPHWQQVRRIWRRSGLGGPRLDLCPIGEHGPVKVRSSLPCCPSRGQQP
jgi:hypothetical protein